MLARYRRRFPCSDFAAINDMLALPDVSSIARFSPPYGLLADAYDDVIGRNFFDHIRRKFEHLVARHRIGFFLGG